MKAEEIRDLSAEELTARIAELEEERFRLRFRSASEALEEPLRLRKIRRDIARMQTVRRERELGLARGARPASKARGR
jgi:large subunit ribosomal protein L29